MAELNTSASQGKALSSDESAPDRRESAVLPDSGQQPASSTDGLSQAEATKRLAEYGPNEIREKKPGVVLKFLGYLWGPVPWMLEAAIILELILNKRFEAGIIGALVVFNAFVSMVQESRAGQAVAMLRRRLTIQVRVRRDGAWQTLPASVVVPGDVLGLGMGDLVAADVRLLDGNVLIDQSTVTGESNAIDAAAGATAYMGSLIKRGKATGLVTATGSKSSYGKTAESVHTAGSKGHLQQTIFGIVRSLVLVDVGLIAVLIVYALMTHLPLSQVIPFCLILIIASVPVSLPPTFTLSAALGTQELAKRGVLVSRLAAIEEAAAMDVLATDKTGTLTKNELSLSEVKPAQSQTDEAVLRFAMLASDDATQDPIDSAILAAGGTRHITTSGYARVSFAPFDPANKISEAAVRAGNDVLRVVKGAPHVIAALVPGDQTDWARDADTLAAKGYRVLAIAAGPEKSMVPIGLVALLDQPRDDAGALVQSLKELGIRVLMVTGDGPATAQTVATEVGITGPICSVERFRGDPNASSRDCEVFAGIFPDDKIHLVEALQKAGHVLGMTGDGVNDAPALKQAEVGIAVASATDVAKAAASAVLTSPGLGDVVAAVETSRRIYQRMLTYTLNKIVKTLLLATLLTLGVLFTHELILTPLLMILLIFVNDFVTMSISTDNVSFSQKPERWNVRSLVQMAVPLAGLSLACALTVLFVGRTQLHSVAQVQTLVFITLAFNGQGMTYLVRERSHLWHSRPSTWLLASSFLAVTVVCVFATFGILMASLPPLLVICLLAATVIYLIGIDFAKVLIFERLVAHGTPASAT